MTFDEWWNDPLDTDTVLAKRAWNAAVVAEREACAELAFSKAHSLEVTPAITGEVIYMARYGHLGAIWASNETQEVWNDWAERLNDVLKHNVELRGAAIQNNPRNEFICKQCGLRVDSEHKPTNSF